MNRNVTILFATTFIMGVVASFTSWFLPVYLERYGALELVVIVYTFANLIAIVPTFAGGVLSDILGRRTLILVSTFLYSVSFAALLVANPLVVASAAIVLMLAAALIYTPETALLGESVDSSRVGTVFSYFRFLSAVATAIGSFVLGYVSTYMGIEMLIVLCILTSIVCLALRFFLKETGVKLGGAGVLKETLKQLKYAGYAFRTPLFMILGVAIVVVGVGAGVFSVYFPIFLSRSLGFSDVEIGTIFAASSLVSAVAFTFVGFIVDKLGWLKSFIAALSVEGALILAFSATSALTLPGATVLLTAMLLYASLALFSAIDQVAGDRMLIDVTRRETRGTIIASLASLALLSRVPAPLIGAAVATRGGFQASIAAASASYFAGALLLMLILRRFAHEARVSRI
ncbi:MAG: MFS transporter [Desulfurococcaceae archaeon]